MLRVDRHRVELQAAGPLVMDVSYRLPARARGTEVRAQITVRPGTALLARALTAAVEGVLRAGVLRRKFSLT
jgi:hypothetical protein